MPRQGPPADRRDRRPDRPTGRLEASSAAGTAAPDRLGVFDTLLVEDGGAVNLDAHLARLARSVSELYGETLPPIERADGAATGRCGSRTCPGSRSSIETRPLRAGALPVVLTPYVAPGRPRRAQVGRPAAARRALDGRDDAAAARRRRHGARGRVGRGADPARRASLHAARGRPDPAEHLAAGRRAGRSAARSPATSCCSARPWRESCRPYSRPPARVPRAGTPRTPSRTGALSVGSS